MNLGKPRRRLEVAQRPSIDIDAQVGSDELADTTDLQDRQDMLTPGTRREMEAVDDRTDR